ncbi:CD48 antigen [Anabarilius grahami]|uniref:CD48 antigen n=1 Tax=Anabarilius grahami TaxID=495550 RepID=A0A3N0YGM0_ANAGA|nr:CD48 antigen [Anabarilius grahami]
MAGNSLTLRTDLTGSDAEIEWWFGSNRTLITTIEKGKIKYVDKRFGESLQVERQTGDLTFANVSDEHNGVYELNINDVPTKKFRVTVYARLPVPVILKYSPQCSSSSSSSSSSESKSVLLCSVLDVSHVTLSWYKGSSLLSNISVSNLSISISLPLEVEHQDRNTYRCVINNPISNQTKHLDISGLCRTRSDGDHDWTEAVIRLVIAAVVGVAAVAAVVVLVYDISSVSESNRNRLRSEFNSGVFGVETDEIKVMAGDSFTLRTGLTEIQRDDDVEWRFGSNGTRITRIAAGNVTRHDDEKFRGRLKLERQTGDLTITNVSNEHNGVYQLIIIIKNKKTSKRFAVTVHATLPTPVIFSDPSQCSERSRIVLCSVLNVSHVTLSWYKENGLLSSISVSDLSISISLPLEVEHQDKNTYICVINNPVSSQTKHLDISGLCQTPSDCDLCFDTTEAVIRLVVTALMGVAAVAATVLLINDIRRAGRTHKIKRRYT